jgi:hypothetical protein
MQVSIPVLVTEQKQPDQSAPTVAVRPLFALQPVEQGAGLQRALNKLVEKLREEFEELAAKAQHYNLAQKISAPHFSTKMLRFRLFLSHKSFNCRYLFVIFEAFGKLLI